LCLFFIFNEIQGLTPAELGTETFLPVAEPFVQLLPCTIAPTIFLRYFNFVHAALRASEAQKANAGLNGNRLSHSADPLTLSYSSEINAVVIRGFLYQIPQHLVGKGVGAPKGTLRPDFRPVLDLCFFTAYVTTKYRKGFVSFELIISERCEGRRAL
jgi:hypothetical protein